LGKEGQELAVRLETRVIEGAQEGHDYQFLFRFIWQFENVNQWDTMIMGFRDEPWRREELADF